MQEIHLEPQERVTLSCTPYTTPWRDYPVSLEPLSDFRPKSCLSSANSPVLTGLWQLDNLMVTPEFLWQVESELSTHLHRAHKTSEAHGGRQGDMDLHYVLRPHKPPEISRLRQDYLNQLHVDKIMRPSIKNQTGKKCVYWSHNREEKQTILGFVAAAAAMWMISSQTLVTTTYQWGSILVRLPPASGQNRPVVW